MTFSRHYAKARKAALKQQNALKKTPDPAFQGQAQRVIDPQAAKSTMAEPRSYAWLWKCCLVGIFAVMVTALIHFRHALIVPIRHINVEGQISHVNPQALQAVLSSVAEHSMFADLHPLQERVKALPWVKTVEIKRVWPNALIVSITQVEPMARFNDNWLLSTDGSVFIPPSLAGLEQLPLLIGPQDKALFLWQGYRVMSDLLKPAGLTIWRLSLSPRFSYEAVLNNGLILYLGASQVTERLQLFIKVYQQQLAPKVNQIAYVDLRYASSLAISWKAPTPATAPTPAAV